MCRRGEATMLEHCKPDGFGSSVAPLHCMATVWTMSRTQSETLTRNPGSRAHADPMQMLQQYLMSLYTARRLPHPIRSTESPTALRMLVQQRHGCPSLTKEPVQQSFRPLIHEAP